VGAVFLLSLVMVAPFLGGAVVWWWDPGRRARRLLARAEEKPLRAVGDGDYVRVRGVARRARGSLEASFSGRSCIGFSVLVEEFPKEGHREILRLARCLPFVLEAEGVEALVEGPFLFGLEIDHRVEGVPPQAVRDTLAKHGVSMTDAAGWPRQLGFFEAALEDGDTICVLGRVSVGIDRRGHRESFRSQPVLRVFEGSRANPVVLADAPQRQTGASDV
jgi:hypothetical protein